MYQIESQEMSPEFQAVWLAAAEHLNNLIQAEEGVWLRCHPYPPFLDHLSFRLGNQLFFIRVEDADRKVAAPGTQRGVVNLAEQAGGHPCALLMRRGSSLEEWKPVYPGHSVADMRTGKPINPMSLRTDEKIAMTLWEIHAMGIQVVVEYLQEQGLMVTSWQTDPGVDPQVWFQNPDGEIEWVVVRTVSYPEDHAPRPAHWASIADSTQKPKHSGRFASVALSSGDQNFKKSDEPVIPLWRGQGMMVGFSGFE